MIEIRAPARERCAYCGRPARGRCSNCNKPYCGDHGVLQCSSCSEPLRPLPSPRLYRGTVAVFLIGAVLAMGLLWQPWPGAAPGVVSVPELLEAAVSPAPGAGAAPQTEGTTGSPANYIEYTIKAGDTLGGLTGQFNTTVEAIMAVNPRLNPTSLQLGQVVRIPLAPASTLPSPQSAPPPSTPTPVSPGFAEYTVKGGDTLWDIATLYSTTVEAIMSANNLDSGSVIRQGQVLRVPRS